MGNESIKKKTQKLFIEPLEQRIMLDGAGASTFLDLIDERNQQQIKINSSNKDIYKEGDNSNKDIPFTNITRDKIRNDKKNIVFIDSAVEDYETITSSFKENTEFYLINANEDGFKRISEILSDRENIDALHLIGHGSAGQILFGNAFLNNETIDNYQATLASIGQSLTTSGDILFYGCNVASTEQGEILIKKISEITKADIAASDDLTGKDGDWVLENKLGIVETQNFQIGGYDHNLVSTSDMSSSSNSIEISHLYGTTIETSSTPDLTKDVHNDGNVNNVVDWYVYRESSAVSISSSSYVSEVDIDGGYQSLGANNTTGNANSLSLRTLNNNTGLSSATVSSYYVYYTDANKNASPNNYKTGGIVFDGEIIGIFFSSKYTLGPDNPIPNKASGQQINNQSTAHAINDLYGDSNADYYEGSETSNSNYTGGRVFEDGGEYFDDDADISTSIDSATVSNFSGGTNNWLRVRAKNGNGGDIIRVIVKENTNNDPVARNDVGHVAEDGTLQVDNGDNANVSGSYDAAGEHSGDVLQTSSGTHQDTDADSDTLVVASVRTGGTEGSGTSGTLGQALTGSYGQLTLNSNGSYTYVANQSAADALDVGDTVTDVFNYTVSDGNGGTDIATITITIHGANDAPVAADNTATVNEDDTITVTDGETAQNQTYEVNNTIDSSTSLTVGSGTHGSGISFSHDGKKMFKTDYEIDQIHQWTLSTAFDPTSKSGSPTSASLDFDVSDNSRGDWPVGHAWNSDGTKLFVVNWDGVDEYWIHSYDLSTAYDVSTISLVSPSASNSYNTNLYNVKSLAVSSDGTKFYFVEDDAQEIRQITFATAYDVSSSASSATLSISDTTFPVSLAFSDNGKKLFVGDANNEKIHQYNLTTAWDISSGVSYDGGITLTTTIDPYGIVFTDGGTKMLILDEAGETVDVHSLKSPFNLIDIDDEHDGDVLLDDTDADTSASLTVSAIRTGSVEGSGTSGSVGSALTGTYGQLTIAANGSYSYVANQSAADALDAGDIVTDSFNYTVSDGTATDTAVITITVIGVNDAPVADNETGSVDVSNTLTVTDGSSDLLHGDTDVDGSASLTVSSIVATTASGSATAVNPGTAYNSGYTSVTGSYGTLRVGADGTYQYIASSSAGTDVFTYTLFDGTATDTATLTITVNAANTAPTASNSTVYINENNQVSSAGDRTPSNITKIFAASDFNYSDSDSDSLSKVKITTLESAGALEHYNGSSWVDVTLNQEITASDIGNNYLRFTPAANSESNPTFGFKVHDGTEYSSSAYTMTISVNAAPNVTDTTVGSTVSAGGTSSGDVHDGVADSDDADSVLVVTGVASGNESSNNTIVTNNTGVGSAVSGTYGSLNIAANGTYTYTASSSNNISHGSTATDTFTFTTRDDETNSGSFAYDVGTITFTVASSGSAPVARNDTGNINVGGTLTVSNSSNATSVDTATFSSSDSYSHGYGDTSGLVFNDDGTKVYFTDSSDQRVYQRNLGTAFDISTGTGSVSSIFLSNITPYSLSFNNDGTKLYVLEYNAVKEYALTTGFDVTTASLAATESLSSQEGAMRGLTFNNDGTKMFTVGDSNNRVYEYALSSAFDISSLSFTDYISVSSQESSPQEIKFNHDGTKMYISGFSGDDINEYTLSTAFDISSTVTHKGSYSVSSSDGSSGALGFSFNNDGTKLFTTGSSYDRINEHSLTTPFSLVDVSGEHSGDVINTSSTDNYDTDADGDTLTVTNISHSNSNTDTVDSGSTYSDSGGEPGSIAGTYGTITIGADGSYKYEVADNSTMDALDAGDIVTDVFTYTISDGNGGTDTATITITITGINDAPTAVADTDTVTANGTVTNATNSAGTLVSDDTDVDASSSLYVTKITHSNGNSSEVTYNSTRSSNAATIVGSKGTLTFGSDGSYSYAANLNVTTGPDIFTYTLTDGTSTTTSTLTIDVVVNHFGYIQEGKTLTVANTASLVSGTSTGSHTGDIVFNDTSDTYTVTHIRPGSGSTVSVTDVTYSNGSATSVDGTYGTLTIGSDGSYQYVANSNINDLDAGESNVTDTFTYTENIGGVATTKTLTIYVIPSQDLTARNDTGNINVGGTLTVSNSSNATSVDTATFSSSDSYSHGYGDTSGLVFNDDGTKVYFTDSSDQRVYQRNLGTAFDISTGTGSVSSIFLSNITPYSLSFNNDGTKLYVLEYNAVKEYALTTGFDVTTASLAATESLSSQEGAMRGLTFNNDGTKMFTVGDSNNRVYEYALSSAFDISSLSFTDYISVSSQESSPQEIKFNHDGTKMYISGFSGDDINEYTLSTAFDISSTVTHKGSYSVSSSDGSSGALGFSFNNDGTKLFTTGSSYDRINEHSLTTPFSLVDVSGEHSGDVINTSSTDNYDTDPDSDTLTVTAIRTGSSEGSGTAGSVGSALTGTYGNLTIAANGSYTYVVADNSTMDALDAGDIVTDTFNYTVSDGQGETDIATITITITGINDAPTAVADTDTVTANGTVTNATNSAGTLVSDDTDVDASSSLYVTKITHSNGNSSEVTYNSTRSSNAATIVGSKGTLTFGSDGSYSYAANLNVTTGPDIFTYTLTDGTSTTTSTLTIDVVVNHFGYIQEGKTLTVANTASLVSGTSTGSHTGDIVFNDTSDTYTVTHIRPGSGSTVSVTDVTYSNGSATSVDGTYGTLTIGSDGSYQYVANSNINDLDAGESNVTDTFTYTENIGGVATTKTLTIYVIPSQDLTARNDTGNINVGGTLTVSNSSNATSVDTATFSSSDSYSHGYGDTSGLVFNDDGTKVYFTDSSDQRVYQRNLGTAFDISTGTGSVSSIFLSNITPYSLSFNNDGTKLYVLEYNAVKEYALTTGFDVTTASLAATESLSSQEGAMRGLTFNNDGTKMFTVGDSNNRVYEYALSSAFDISSLSFTDYISVSSQESSPQEIKFNHDGTKMYISGFSGDDINEYTLSTAFDISSTVTHKGSYSVSSSDGSSGANGFSFNNDGTKLFTTGSSYDRINEHSLTTPFSLVDVSGEHSGDVINTSSTDNYDTDPDSDTLTVTAIRTGSSEGSGTAGSVGSALTGTYGNLTIAANGSYTYVVADNSTMDALDAGDIVTDTFNYTVSDGQGETDIATITITITGINDAPTAVADTDTVTANGTVTNATNSAGTLVSDDTDVDASSSLYVTKITHSNGNSSEVTYNSTRSSNAATIVGSKGTLTFGSDGSYSYAANLNVTTGPDIFTYTLTDGTSTTTSTLTIDVVVNHFGYIQEGKTLTVANTASLVSGTSTGSHTGDIVFNDTSDTYTVTHIRPGSGSTVSVTDVTYSNGSATSVDGTYGTLTIGSDGSYQYVANSNINDLDAGESNVTDTFTYTENIGGVATTKTLTIYVIPSQDLTARNDTGNINVGGTLTVSNSSNATSVDTATFSSSDSYSHGYGDTSGLVFNDDGTKVYFTDSSDQRVYQRNLGTAFDISTGTGSVSSIFLSNITPYSLSFNNDGTKLYVLEYNAVKEYALTTGFDVTTASLAATESLSSQEGAMRGLTFNNDGTKMFTVGDSNNRVYEYALSSAFDISSLSFTDYISVSSQESSPQEIKFNHDGTKMYISGFSGDDINEYTLSTAFDISSTVTHKGSYSVSSSDGSSGANGFSFNNDGTKLFTTGSSYDRINEHSLTTPFSLVDVSGEHSGDVINTSSTDNYDTDPDSDTLTVTAIRTGSSEGSGTAGSVGSALTGTYGNLTIAANGSYTYVVADNSTMDALDAGDIVTDTFNYTVSDGQGETDIATITITITGINDAPVADNETGSVNISQTLTVTDGSSDLLDGDTDADGSASLRVSSIVATTASGSATAVNLGTAYNSGYTSVTGSYGTLRIGADGTYRYVANSSAGTDVFTYTLSDGTATDTATLTITVNTAPVARNDVGHVAEDGTLQVDNGDNANVSGSYDAVGEHSGDVLQTSSGTHQDTDANSDTLTVTAIRTGSVEGSGTSGSVGSALTGTYGQLTIAANGSYTYVANQSAADALDVGDTVTDVFNYTVSDGNGGTDIATITITIHGANDAPVADNETGSVRTSQTLTVTDGSSDLLDGDTDADGSASLRVSSIVATTASGSATAVNSGTTYNSSYTEVTGSYGTLRVGADGTYQYIAGSNNGTDVFTYTLSDGTATDTATLTITVAPNSAPSATNDTDAVNEDATITESSGSKLLVADDTDANSDTLTVTAIKVGGAGLGGSTSVSAGSSYNSNFTSVTGTYGTLKVGADGSYTYVADQSAADDLDLNDQVTDTFTYTVSDGAATDTATLIITVTGVNDTPVADNETGAVNEDATLTVTDGTSDVLHGDTDADDSASLTATTYSHTSATNESGGSASSGNGNSGTAGSSAVVGYYGTLTLAADGTYTYAADQSTADLLDASDTVTDVFTYTVSDGSATDTATITITITGVNDAPVAQNDTGTVNEDATLTVSNSSNATSVTGVSQDTGSPYAINEGTVRSVTFNADGTKMFVVHAPGSAKISEHALTTAFDINTASQSTTYDISSHISEPRGIRFNSDGTKLYIISSANSNKKIHEFSLSTAYDISSLPTPSSTVISSQDGGPRGFTFNTDGTKMFLLGDTSHHVYEYSLSTAFDTTTISYTSRSLDFSSREVTPRGISFNPTGSKLFITGQSSDEILEYDLSTGFNLSTATFNGAFDVGSFATKPNDIVFNNDGTKAFMARANSNGVLSFSLTSPYSFVDISGEHTGDVLDTSSSSNSDSDADTSASLTVSAIRTGSSEGSGTSGSVGSALTGTYGQLTIAANGSYTYVANQSAADALDAGDIVTDSFNYTVSDGTATDTAVITITVIGVNDAPVADNETGAVNEDATLTVSDGTSDLLHGDTDADGSASLTISAIRTGAEGASGTAGSIGSGLTGTYGTLTVAADGTYTYVADQSAADDLDASDTATDVFTYTVSDGKTSDTATLTITITGVNDAPVAVNDTDAVNEDATVTQSSGSSLLMADDTDADDDDSFTVTQIAVTGGSNNAVTANSTYNSGSPETVTGTYGQLTVGANGTYTYVANQSAADDLDAGDTATDSFTYTISDGDATDTATLIFTVTGVNDVPTASNKTVTTNEDTAYVFSASDFGYTDADDDDALVSIKITTLEDAGALQYYNGSAWVDVTLNQVITATDIAANKLRFNPAADENGSSYTTFNFTVNDGDSDSATPNTITVNVTAVNDAPVADNETGAVNEDATLTVTDGTSDVLHGDTDVDSGDTLTVTQIAVTGGSNSSVAGSSTYNSNFTTVTGTYGTLKIGADGTYTYVADQSAADDLDASDTATDSFTYTVSDGTATDTATIIITVTGVNDAPVAVNDTDAVNEDATVTQSSGSSLLMADDTDADDDDSFTVTQIAVTGGSNSAVSSGSSYNSSGTQVTGTYGTLTVGADGTYTYVADQSAADDLDASDTATDSFTYTISDGDATDTATLIFTVTGVNDAPVAVNDTDAVNEDATVTRTSGSSLLMADDSDADDDDSFTVTQIAVTGGSNSAVSSGTNQSNGTSVTGTYGTLTVGANGTYTYVADQSAADDLDASDTATDSFTYTISDGDATDTATLIFTVTGVNDAPVAVNDTDAVNEDATVTQSSGSSLLMADDSDADDDDSFTVTQIAVTGGSNSAVTSGSSYNSNGKSVTGTYGTLTVGADGTYTYVADQSAADDLDASDTATDSFTYTISDGDATDTATLIFTVTGVNDAPVADNETGAVNEDATLTVSDGTSDLLHGDTDADDSASLTITTYSHTSATDESSGTASSGNGNSGTAGSSAVVGYYGTLTLAADGTYTYAADQNVTDALDASDTVTDVFTYTLSDGTATDTATLTITITGVNDAPVAVADTDTVQLTDTVTNSTNGAGTVISDDTDADSSSSLSVTSITATTANGSAQTTFSSNTETVVGSYGTLTINSDGSYSYVAGSSAGTDVFTYVVSDGSLTSSTTLTFSVTLGNPPVAANDTDSVNEDATVTQSTGSGLLVADDTDADGNTLTVTQIAVTGSSNNAVTASSTYNSGSPETVTGTYGQLTVGADGSYTYVANQSAADDLDAGDQVTDSFTYTVSDGINTVTATLIITVTGVNDAPVAVNDTDAVNEDATVTRTSGSSLLMADDTDADDDDSFTVTQIAVTGQSNSAVNAGSSYNSSGTSITGTYGTLIVGADGTYTYVADQSAADDLDASDTATDSFTYTISDGDTTDTATLIFTVTGVNDLPTASNNTITTNEDTNHVFSTSDFNFSDADDSGSLNKIKITSLEDNGALQYYNGSAWVDVTLNQEITATDIANNKLRFKPDTNENGSSYTSFGFQVSDGTAYSSSSYTMTVNVTAVNDAPSAANDTVSVNEDATTTVSSASSGVIDDNDTDPDSSDTLTITNIAHTNGNTESVTASTTYSNGQSITGTYGTLTIGADGTYTYVADQTGTDALDASDQVTDVFTYTLSDGTTTTTATITVTVTGVNDSPVAVNDTGSVNEDATLTVSTASSGVTQNNDTDPDTDDTASTLVVNQITPNGGSASSVSSGTTYSNGTSVTGTYGTLTIGANGTYTYVANRSAADDLDAGDTATDVFTYRVTDTTGATATADITITVTGINDIPTASDNTVSTAEDTPYVFSTSDFGYTDADDDDALVSIKITTLETNGALQYYNGSAWVDVTLNQVITVSDITSGYLRLNPDANENGSPYTTIKFTVNDGDADSATPNTITVNVTAVNDAPTATNDTASVNEDATTTVSSASNGVIDDNDTDTESDTLVITNIAHTNGNTESVTANTTHSNGQSIVGTYGTLTIGANGTYTYVADQNATDALDLSDQVTDVFTYTISDGNGGTDTASITVTVTGVNDAPTSTGGTITTNEDENYTLTVNDFNFSDPDDSGSLNKVKITTLETNGNLEYYNGTAWVAVTLNQEITASDITSGYLRFRPDANENGSSYTTFGYQVSDGTVYSSATTMTVNVTAVNDAPVATDDASSVNEDSNVRVRANADDLLNDDSDPESDSLTVTLIKPLNGSNTSVSSGSSTTITGTYGQLTVNSNGAYNYQANQDAADTLDTGESAQEQFVYTVSDGNGGTDTGILTITINGVEDNPNAVRDNVSLNISQSSTLTGNAITNDIDPDDSLTIVGCGQGRNPNVGTAKTVGTAFDSNYGQMTINADGTYTFVAVSNIKDLLDPGQSVTEKFYYTISDGNSTSTAMIQVTVQRDNVVQELTRKEQKQIRKQISKDRLNEPSTIRLPNKTAPTKTIEQTADALDNISSTKKLSFSEGIKLVDLVAETGSLTTTDGSLDKVRAKEKDGQLNLKFKVSTDLGNQVVRYEGVMPDGSKLPDWIKVDPKTGKTTTNIPEGVEQVDFTIIAIDQQNNKKEIAVSIDPKEIREDKSIFKQAKKQNASLSVDQSGNVNIVKTNENGDVNQTETKNLNANEKQNTSNITTRDLNLDNTNDIKNIIDTIKSDQVYQLQTINNGETLEIKVPETLLGNFEKTKLVLKDGSAIPDWVEFNPITGEINANPPEDVDKLEFKLIIERDGEIIVKDLAVDVGSDDNAQILDDKEDTKFIAFKDQLNKEHDNWEEYGSNIINRL